MKLFVETFKAETVQVTRKNDHWATKKILNCSLFI